MSYPPTRHARIKSNPTHTCATCKETAPNNYALERHASQKRHKAFLCICTMKFVRLATLNRHIADQAGPKHYCDYCDDNKGFTREDKLIDHLRAGHKFGEKAIVQVRSRTRAKAEANGLASSAAMTTGTALAVSTTIGHHAVPDATVAGPSGASAGLSAGSAGNFDYGSVDLSMFNAVELQPFNTGSQNSFPGAAESFSGSNVSGVEFSGDDFAGFDISGVDFTELDFTGVDFAHVDRDVNVSGIDNGF